MTMLLLILATAVQALPPGSAVSGGDALDVYETVLRFYGPPSGQARWLDRGPLDAGGTAALDAADVAELVHRLGAGRFCSTETPASCRSERGGDLRVSALEQRGDGRVAVVVEFRSRAPYSPSTTSRQRFVLERRPSGWRIVSRAGVASR